MTKNCSDAISILSLAHFDYKLMIAPNLFYKPDFKLRKKEKRIIELEIKKLEPNY